MSDDTGRRLDAWRTGCERGWSTAEIAISLGIAVTTLQQTVYRARKRGDDRAVYHPRAGLPGQGLARLVDARSRAAHVRRGHQATGRDTLRNTHR